ncbi:MAG: DNA-directed RNA polymerase subunit omega [Lachnospiraceae bacterium]|nr:DNA-directed RNA polymerase subunit omega [Lachnospiraceae bacterium]MCI9546566.1 DNA-directed RNA polymerase subunit omega [Lachnospiraceae bacterium]
MIHPSYSELMQVVNKDTEIDEPPVVNSRYSIVLATSKRARQIIGGDTPLVPYVSGKKPLSVAIDELYEGKVKIVAEDKNALEEQEEQEQSEELSVQEISELSELSDEPEALENLEELEELPEEPKEEQLL